MARIVRSKPLNLLRSLAQDHAQIDSEVDKLEKALFNLRYEGKHSLGKNLKQVQAVVATFNTDLLGHFELEENVLFPFAETHLPKLESLLGHLKEEHESLKKHLKTVEASLKNLSSSKADLNVGTSTAILRESGMYLVMLLHSHMNAENEIVYKLIDRELRPEEKNRIAARLHKISI